MKEKEKLNKFSFIAASVVFYLNEYIYATLLKEKESQYLHSHVKFRNDFSKFRLNFAKKFAQAIYDYIILACAYEIRDSWCHCEETIWDFLGGTIYNVTKDHILDNIQELDIPEFIKIAKYLFGLGDSFWDYMYGGNCWLQAIEHVEKYGKISNVEFIDRALDMQHNSGSLFSKDTDAFLSVVSSSLKSFLDKKYSIIDENELFNCLMWYFSFSHCFDNYRFYYRFIMLYKEDNSSFIVKDLIENLLKHNVKNGARYLYALMHYEPIKYTGKYKKYLIEFSSEVQKEYEEYNP